MKTKVSILLICIIILILVPADADIMTPGMKSIDRCVKIDNLDAFPDVVLVGYITGPVIMGENPYIITSVDCLTQFYKANELTIYAVEKSYLNNAGIENINFQSDTHVLAYKMDINPDSHLVSIANPIDKEQIYYSIAGFTDKELVLYESKRISSYTGGIDKIESFDPPVVENLKLNISDALNTSETTETNTGNQTQIRRSFMDTLVFFFNHLFGTRY